MTPAHTAAVIILALLAALPATAQEAETEAPETAEAAEAAPVVVNGQRFGAWTVTCEAIAVGATACVLSQRLVRNDSGGFLAEMLAFWSADGDAAYMAARVPNGVYLPSGLAFQPEDSEDRTEFVWQACSPDLCEALVEIPPGELETLATSGPMLAGYRPGLRAAPVVFRLGMDGLAEGMEALK